ncbi:MAG TPA: aminoglycoside phosphotransferase family protein [Candidatus Limnocylindrales bacterium]|nr:aminoglycoside phosphotransferase family protein [Candidatus Limnocylindrales bacterium]
MTLSDEEVTTRLGDDLAALALDVGARLLGATRITGLRARALERQTFKLRYSGGLRLKGRRMDRVEDAERAFRLGALLDEGGFSRPIAQRGVALLEPWIAGTRIDLAGPTDAALRECGRLLGTVHALAVDVDGDARRWQPQVRLRDIEARLDQLRRLGLLSVRASMRLVGVARESAPDVAVVGVVHRDLWPRNVVVDAAGRPHVIDNASISIGAHAFDRARTSYLWPMATRQRAAFDAGYGESAPQPPADSPFWMIDVLSDVALFRRLAGARGVSKPISQLRLLAGAA